MDLERARLLEEHSRIEQDAVRAQYEREALDIRNRRREAEAARIRKGQPAAQSLEIPTPKPDEKRPAPKQKPAVAELNPSQTIAGADPQSHVSDLEFQRMQDQSRFLEEQKNWQAIRHELETQIALQTQQLAQQLEQRRLEIEHWSRLEISHKETLMAKAHEWQARCSALEQEIAAQREKDNLYVPPSTFSSIPLATHSGLLGAVVRVVIIWTVVGILLVQLLAPAHH